MYDDTKSFTKKVIVPSWNILQGILQGRPRDGRGLEREHLTHHSSRLCPCCLFFFQGVLSHSITLIKLKTQSITLVTTNNIKFIRSFVRLFILGTYLITTFTWYLVPIPIGLRYLNFIYYRPVTSCYLFSWSLRGPCKQRRTYRLQERRKSYD